MELEIISSCDIPEELRCVEDEVHPQTKESKNKSKDIVRIYFPFDIDRTCAVVEHIIF